MTIAITRHYNRQPLQGVARINRASPLYRGNWLLHVPGWDTPKQGAKNLGGLGTVGDTSYVSNAPVLAVQQGPGSQRFRDGRVWRWSTTSTEQDSATIPLGDIGTGNFSWVARVRLRSKAGATFHPFAGFGTYSPDFEASQFNDGPWGMYLAGAKPANTTLTVGRWYTLCICRTGTGAGQTLFYADAVADGTATAATSLSNNVFTLGGDGGGSESDTDVAWIGFWSRALSQREVRTLHESFWQEMLLPRRQIIGVVEAAGAPPVGGLPPAMLAHRGAVGGVQIDGGMLS